MTVKESLLKSFPDADFTVSVVWVGEDPAAVRCASAIFDDPRVVQFHDPHWLAGKALAYGLIRSPKIFDIYLFYDSQSTWTKEPPQPTQWFHQLGGVEADPAHLRSGVALAESLYDSMFDLRFKPATDSPPTADQLDEAKKLANSVIANAARSTGSAGDGDRELCSRCAKRGAIAQCLISGWRYLEAFKNKPFGRGGTVRMTGYPKRPEGKLQPETQTGRTELEISGMSCLDCATNVVLSLLFIDEVARVDVDYDARRVYVVVDPRGSLSPEQLVAAIQEAGYDAKLIEE